MLIPYMSGIAFKRVAIKDTEKYMENMVRIPRLTEARKNKTRHIEWVWSAVKNFLFSRNGVMTNLGIVAVHLFVLICIPVAILLACIWSLFQVEIINEDIFATTYGLDHVFIASRYDYWLDHMPAPELFWAMMILSGLFILIGFIELASFYATGARDTGKYIVAKSFWKHMSIYFFWMMLLIFITIYVAYISVILAWCILGAIISPEKFLPIATGAAVLVIFIYSLRTKLEKVYDALGEAVSSAVDEELRTSLVNAIESEAKRIENSIESTFNKFKRQVFHKTINACLIRSNYQSISKDTSDSIMKGDMGALLDLLHENCGIHRSVGLALIGYLKQDNIIILDSVDKLATELQLNREISTIICEIILDKYNPYSSGIGTVTGKIVLTFKKLFRKVFPTFPLEAVDTVLQVICEADPRPLDPLMETLGIPDSVYNIGVALATKKEEDVFPLLNDLADEIFPEHYKFLFQALYSISKGDPKRSLNELSECLGIEHEFILSMIIA